jgi:hypothetical protein
MQTIRILFSQYSLPSESSFYKINFENFRDLLKDKVKIELICLVYRSRRLTDEEKLSNDKKVIDFRDYSNAVEVIKKENPDIIVAGGWSTALISNSLVLAAKFLKIPVVNWLQMPLFDNELAINRKNTFVKLLQSQNPTDNDKQFMMRGRFFLKRYLFFFNTQRAIGTKISKIFELLFSFFKKFFIFNDKVFNPQFSGDLSFLSGEKLLKNLLELGFDNKKLVLTGFPAYDKSFQILSSFQPKTGDKIRVLFAPTTFYEHGDWTKNQRDKILKEIIKNLNDHKEKIVLTVKIHPSYSNLIEYQEIINSINPSIPLYRTKDFLELVANSDVVLDYSGVSTSLVFALIAKKPIVLCNYDHISDDIFLEKGLALKCTNPSLLFQSIMSVLKSNPASDEKREKFIRDYLYSSDGKASERIFDKMISLLPSFEK